MPKSGDFHRYIPSTSSREHVGSASDASVVVVISAVAVVVSAGASVASLKC